MNYKKKFPIFFCRKHFEFIPGWHKTYQAFLDNQTRDFFKNKECEDHDVFLIIVSYWIEPAEMQDYIIKDYIKILFGAIYQV